MDDSELSLNALLTEFAPELFDLQEKAKLRKWLLEERSLMGLELPLGKIALEQMLSFVKVEASLKEDVLNAKESMITSTTPIAFIYVSPLSPGPKGEKLIYDGRLFARYEFFKELVPFVEIDFATAAAALLAFQDMFEERKRVVFLGKHFYCRNGNTCLLCLDPISEDDDDKKTWELKAINAPDEATFKTEETYFLFGIQCQRKK
jgi:hypothetical protein